MKVLLVFCLMAASTVLGQESSLMPDYDDHPCVRTCQDDGEPMVCQYRFVVESYQTLSRACYACAEGNVTDCLREHCVTANGFSRNIKTVNRGIPGPAIQVCEGDTVVVDLENYFLMSEGVTIHWHGILQLFSPHMDGVGWITQCPIPSSTTFQYKFVVIDPGTHFWHAHTGMQRGEGVFGSLVVRQSPSREPHTGNYDFDLPEHVFIVNEWQNQPLIDIYTNLQHAGGPQKADSVLINGRDVHKTGALTLPRAVFEVEPEQRYRFRVINSGSLFCPLTISVDNHTLTLIASDGRAFDPLPVQSFDIYSAERYDFIIHSNQPVGDYWLRATGLGTCTNLEGRAILRYLSAEAKQLKADTPKLKTYPAEPPETTRPEVTGRTFNSISVERDQPLVGDVRDQIIGMNASYPDDRSMTGDPNHQFILEFGFAEVANLHYYDPDLYPPGGPYPAVFSAQVNRISNRLGPAPLLSQMDEIPPEMFCNSSSVGNRCESEWCECVHKITAKQDDLVEIVFISPNGNGFTHPVHLHGFSYRVVGMDRSDKVMSAELFREMDTRGEIDRKRSRAPFKDTVAIPNGGYTIIRFVADNPGVWFFHCHLAFHVEIGMALSLEILQPDGRLPPPPENFPRCGSFVAPEDKRLKSPSQNGDQHFQASSGPSRSNLLTSNPVTMTLTAQWVFPLVISMGAVIVLLGLAVIGLWKRSRRDEQTKRFPFPSPYQATGPCTDFDEAGDIGGVEHYSYSKQHEHSKLTK